MGNDNKITEEDKSKQIHKEVMLFLGKELERIHKTSTEQTYNIEEEYAKTKKHRSPFSMLMLTGCFVVVFLMAFFITRVISSQNEEITVSVSEFEDLNLKNLLNTVGTAQTNYDNAVKKRAMIEGDMTVKLKAAEDTHTNDLFVIDSMSRLTRRKRNELVAEAEKKYKDAVSAVHEEFDAQLVQAEAEVEEYKSQLAAFDAAKVEAAKEKEKALDSERRVKELEQQKIKDQYESRIAELDKKLSESQKRSSDDIRTAVSSVSAQYQAEIALLDPKLQDEKADEIIENSGYSSAADFNAVDALMSRQVNATKVSNAFNEFQKIYDDYKYLDKTVASIPQKNSIPSYVAASHKLVNKMGLTFADTTVALYNETTQLNNKINSLTGELEASRRQTAEQKEINEANKKLYEANYETLLPLVKSSALLINGSDYDNMPVYVAGKARYLITEEGADAEFKADKTIKGKIFRADDDSFYFVVGEDKNGDRIEVNFEFVAPGTPVKILSK